MAYSQSYAQLINQLGVNAQQVRKAIRNERQFNDLMDSSQAQQNLTNGNVVSMQAFAQKKNATDNAAQRAQIQQRAQQNLDAAQQLQQQNEPAQNPQDSDAKTQRGFELFPRMPFKSIRSLPKQHQDALVPSFSASTRYRNI